MSSFSANVTRSFRHRDFRLLWIGAFLSFTGSWVQNVAQAWLVYDLTKSEAQLGLVSFFGMAPVSVLGPFAGALADTMDRRKLLVAAQVIMGINALILASAIHFHFVTILLIYFVAIANGIAGAFEMPARQSVISRVVPPEDLAAAVPLNSLTINFARVAGAALGGILLIKIGAQSCYLVNGLSYLTLIVAVLAIRADLSPEAREPQPIADLLFEGMKFTFREVRLKTLFIMECIVSGVGLVYLSLIAAFTAEILHWGKEGIGAAMTCVGIGAILGLFLAVALSQSDRKHILILSAMTTMGLALIGLAFFRGWPVYLLLAIAGGATLVQFNTTNALFQILSPARLRGRVISMHIWALAGVSPFGSLLLGWVAERTKVMVPAMYYDFTTRSLVDIHVPADTPFQGVPLVILLGGGIILLGSMWGIANREKLRDLKPVDA